jgi:hypothetical protein
VSLRQGIEINGSRANYLLNQLLCEYQDQRVHMECTYFVPTGPSAKACSQSINPAASLTIVAISATKDYSGPGKNTKPSTLSTLSEPCVARSSANSAAGSWKLPTDTTARAIPTSSTAANALLPSSTTSITKIPRKSSYGSCKQSSKFSKPELPRETVLCPFNHCILSIPTTTAKQPQSAKCAVF